MSVIPFPRLSSVGALDRRLSHRLIEALASEIPVPASQRLFAKQLDVAIVTDTFMYNYYAGAFRSLVCVDFLNYQARIEAHRFDVLIYVSCWEGHGTGYWKHGNRARKIREVASIVTAFRRKGVPTIFQSIEDPVYYREFLEIARMCDSVFTTDSESIDRYRTDLGHSRVYFGEYGVNPMLQNPIASRRPRFDAFFFAGTYYNQHAERAGMMDLFFDALQRAEARHLIADRNYGSGQQWSKYPERYTSHIIDKFEHGLLQRAHKLFRWNVNFNIVTRSPTMCAMRVYELQALGCNIVSNHALSVERLFPNIRTYRDERELGEFLRDPAPPSPHESLEAINRIFHRHTCFHRVHEMLGLNGIEYRLESGLALMTISVDQCRDHRSSIDPRAALLIHRSQDRDIDLIASSLRACFAFSEHPVALWTESPDDGLRHLPEVLTKELLQRSGAILIDARGLDRHLMNSLIDGFCGPTAPDLPDGLEAMVVQVPSTSWSNPSP